MIIESINSKKYFEILTKYNIDIPILSDIESCEIYPEKEYLLISKNGNELMIIMLPIDNFGVRREFRYFPYLYPIFLSNENNLTKKNILKLLFNYIFNKYDYCFIPLHPDFTLVSSIQSEGGFVEMRHTHIINSKLETEKLSSKLRNHINSARKHVQIEISTDYADFDFNSAIKGSQNEIEKRSELAKKILNNNKGIIIKAIQNGIVKAAIMCIYDKNWAYLLHSYQDKSIRGVILLLILEATKFLFDDIKIKIFDFEGSVINEIDDFFSNFNTKIVNYPFVIESKSKEHFFQLVERSMQIEGRINRYEY